MNDSSSTVKRIVIIGTSGSGKSVLGSKIAQALDIQCIDLDDLYWLPGWKERREEEFFQKIKRVISYQKWILTGNYSRASQYIWPQADMIIWLDLPLYLCLWRAFKRSVLQMLFRKKSCNGNYETITRFMGRHSILLWVWKSHSRRKKAYEAHFSEAKDSTYFLRLTKNKQVNRFINQVSNDQCIRFR